MAGQFEGRRLQGTLGSGGRQLALSTVNGSITLLKLAVASAFRRTLTGRLKPAATPRFSYQPAGFHASCWSSHVESGAK
jgi:hypothetical protein